MTQESTNETVKAYKYDLQVSESLFSKIHGQHENITEYFVPTHNLAFNRQAQYSYSHETKSQEKTYRLNIFERKKPRNDTFTEISVPTQLVNKMLQVVELEREKESLKTEINNDDYLNDL